MTTASNWLLNWAIGTVSSSQYYCCIASLTSILAYSTPYMVDPGPGNANLGAKVFFVWGGFCFICIAFVYFM